MKTVKELFDEINVSNDLKNELAEAVKAEKLDEFLQSHGCNANTGDVEKYIKETIRDMYTLSQEDLKNVSGGTDEIYPIEIKQSHILPWSCNPNYSSLIDPETGKIDIKLTCC